MADPTQFPRVSTRGHFAFERGEPYLTDGHTATDYDLVGDIPGMGGGSAPDELLLHSHGFWNSDAKAQENFETLRQSLRDNGYQKPVIGFSWQSDFWGWQQVVRVGRRNRMKLGQFLLDYHRDNPDTTIRLTGHSLGGFLTLETLRYLAEGDRGAGTKIASASLLGAAVFRDNVSNGMKYADGIATVPDQVDNYYSENDGILGNLFNNVEWTYQKYYAIEDWFQMLNPFSVGYYEWIENEEIPTRARQTYEALGKYGALGPTPANYADHDVTNEVAGHSNYIQPGQGCIDRVVADFDPA